VGGDSVGEIFEDCGDGCRRKPNDGENFIARGGVRKGKRVSLVKETGGGGQESDHDAGRFNGSSMGKGMSESVWLGGALGEGEDHDGFLEKDGEPNKHKRENFRKDRTINRQ